MTRPSPTPAGFAFDGLIVALAGARLARLIVDDTILQSERAAFFLRFPPDAKRAMLHRNADGEWEIDPHRETRKISYLGLLVSCSICAGFWTTLAVALMWFKGGPRTRMLVLPWALAMVQVLIQLQDGTWTNIGAKKAN